MRFKHFSAVKILNAKLLWWVKKWPLSLFNINGRVLFSLTGGGLYKEAEALPSEIQKDLLSLSFLVTSLFRINKYTYTKTYKPANTQGYSQVHREFFKEIACQANGEYSFAYVAYNLSDKFAPGLIYNYHENKFSIKEAYCQGENRVISAAKLSSLAIALWGRDVVWFGCEKRVSLRRSNLEG